MMFVLYFAYFFVAVKNVTKFILGLCKYSDVAELNVFKELYSIVKMLVFACLNRHGDFLTYFVWEKWQKVSKTIV